MNTKCALSQDSEQRSLVGQVTFGNWDAHFNKKNTGNLHVYHRRKCYNAEKGLNGGNSTHMYSQGHALRTQ